jgi:glucose-6-phosphate isomerase
LGEYQEAIDYSLQQLRDRKIMARIWARDHKVWKESPAEIADRLGWLDSPSDMQEKLADINELAEMLKDEGFRQALLLGMGGSSLAPEVFRNTFGVKDGYLDLAVLDSTDPGSVLSCAGNLDLEKTIFIVSTKSGGTVETFSFMKYFYNLTEAAFGEERAGWHFAAITDPGSALRDLAFSHRFRAIFLNDSNIGGRYYALSYFGLVPAAMLGMDIEEFLARSRAAAEYEYSAREGETDGAFLGTAMAELAKMGRDKLTFVISPRLAAFGVWLEQLIAESTGKEGQGIVPVVGEPLLDVGAYGNDRFFIFLQLWGDETSDALRSKLEEAGHPALSMEIPDLYDLGAQCFLWEMATAVAGYSLGINPFDQPNVEAAKKLARTMIAKYKEDGAMPEEAPGVNNDGIIIYGDTKAAVPREALYAFLRQAQTGAYAAIQAYVQPTAETDQLLKELRTKIGNKFKLATTSGYGPRFLHSTGQLHKGDGGRGLFIQITADDTCDTPIPDEMGQPDCSVTFGILKAAQASGDRQALLAADRKVIRFHLGRDVIGGLKKLL